MIQVGKYNSLKAVRQTENGIYLMDKGETTEALLPNKFLPDEIDEGEFMDVFIFKDHKNRLTATTQEPKILLHEFACLQVKDVNQFGAFLDWGLDKDLFVPFKEQPGKMIPGNWYIVYLYIDPQTERLVATARYLRFLKNEKIDLSTGQAVDLLIDDRTDLGFNVIINNKYRGLVHANEIFEKLRRGMQRKGFIKKVREDGKIDVILERPGYGKVEPNAEKILELLKSNDGFIRLTDKSSPQEISDQLGMSKKTFKKALGALYKKRLVRLEKDGTYLAGKG